MGKRISYTLTGRLLKVIIIILLLPGLLWGLNPDKKTDQYLVDQWEMSDGIPSNTVLAITQTPDGYLWIGTSRGLVKFDGLKFSNLHFAGNADILPREIRSLLVDRNGLLWIGSSTGLSSFRYRTGQLKTFSGIDGITPDGVRRLKDDMRGNLWISFTASYVNRFSNGKFFAYNFSHGLSGKKINAIIEDRQGNMLFGARENGIFTFRNEKFSSYPVAGLNKAFIVTMLEDWQGELWIGTNKGLFRKTSRGTVRYTSGDGLTDDYITGILEDSDRNVWVATIYGLNRIQKEADDGIVIDNLLKPYLINCLFEDSEKNIWIGTDDSGIKRLKDGKFTSFAPFEAYPGEMPLSLFEDRDGNTWIGSHNGKLFCFRGSTFLESFAPAELSGTGIAAIAEDEAGNLWLGTTGKGVSQKKDRAFTQFSTSGGLADSLVVSVYRDSRGSLWFGTFAGISVLRPGGAVIESLKPGSGLSGRVAANVCEDKNHNIWIAADKGITILKNGEFKKEAIIRYLQDITVTYIHEDTDSSDLTGSVFWIATQGAGLKRFRFGKFFSYTTAEGLTSDFIYQFLEDQQGNFWLMSDSGILRLNKNELNRLADGRIDKIHCTSFGVADGLKSPEFDNVLSRNSALKTGNGEFWFITKRGISIVNPEKIHINKAPPPVRIEAVSFNEQQIPHYPDAKEYRFKGLADISFRFTAPTFLSPEKINFKYRLEGCDRIWLFLPTGKERFVRYKNLSPGTYTFKVTACNAEGVWNQTGDSLSLTLTPFFYQAFLFKIAVFLLTSALLAFLFYLYKKHPVKKRDKYKASPLQPDFADECIKKLKHLMENEKIYCETDISLQAVAEKLSIPPHLLSQILNELLNRNFPDFINSYRILEAKRILKSPKGAEQKIDAVAFAVGFNTTVAFYRAFKKYAGKTPSQYKKEEVKK